jgi:hypothetical protein
MSDIYGRNVNIGGVLNGEDVYLNVAGLDGAGLLVQSVNIAYNQQVTRLRELGSTNIYFVAAGTEGNLSLQKVAGAGSNVKLFAASYGDVCSIRNNSIEITFNGGAFCDGGAGFSAGSFTLNHVLVNSVGVTGQAGNMSVMGTLGAMFVSMS